MARAGADAGRGTGVGDPRWAESRRRKSTGDIEPHVYGRRPGGIHRTIADCSGGDMREQVWRTSGTRNGRASPEWCPSGGGLRCAGRPKSTRAGVGELLPIIGRDPGGPHRCRGDSAGGDRCGPHTWERVERHGARQFAERREHHRCKPGRSPLERQLEVRHADWAGYRDI